MPSSYSGGPAHRYSPAATRSQGKGSYKLDLSWRAIDRDLWPLGSWNKSLCERGPQPRYKGVGKGKGREIDRCAIWMISRCGEIAQLTETDRQGVCATPVPKGPRADYLATEVLPRGCYIDFEDNQVRTAIGAWDEDNAIFRCTVMCPLCRFRPCNRRMWWRLNDHDSHNCDCCKDRVLAIGLLR